ncbi:MAG: hypothetical protein K6G92_09610 [Bacteroidaceae bacterium]|nr:hypothetical protein [Bacteroidaceae bacterium]
MATDIIFKRFSIFPCGWWDEAEQKAKPQQRPQQTQTIEWVYQYIITERAHKATEELRAMLPTATRQQKQDFKALHFEYATFSGTFWYRNARSIISRSPFLTLDIDGLLSLQEARDVQHMLCQDKNIETELCFVSPSGKGVKWIVTLPEWTEGLPFKRQFEMMRNYLGFHYGLDADKSGSDVCRACYLGWDDKCFLNQKYVSL